MEPKEYTISFTDNKSPDWKILTLEIVEGDGSVMFQDVSVNRVNKKGETFPNFDGLIVGSRVKGNLWTSPQGKHYLFAPNLTTVKSGASGGGFKAGMQKMVEQKQEAIKLSQENKNESIKIASTLGKAVDCAIAVYEKGVSSETLEELITKWRRILWMEWDNTKDFPPFA